MGSVSWNTSPEWLRRQSRIAAFAFAASIDPNDPSSQAFLKRINSEDPSLKKRSDKQSARAISIATAYNHNNPGLFIDQYIRKFLLEYNNRVLHGKGSNLPSSANIMRAFMEPSGETYILELCPEDIYTIKFDVILDFLTRPGVERNISSLLSSAEEFKVYEFNMFGVFSEFELPGKEQFVFCGFSFVREHTELSIIGLFGKKNPNPRTNEIVDISSGQSFQGIEKILNTDKLDISDFPLFGDHTYKPIVMLMRLDLETMAVQARYALEETEDTYVVYSDDPFLLTELNERVGEDSPIFDNIFVGLKKYDDLFAILIQMPLFIEEISQAEDRIKVIKYPTEFKLKSGETRIRKTKKEAGNRRCPNFVNVSNLLDDATGDGNFTVPASGLRVENSGYWKTLSLDAVGADKHGNPIQGKTWVEQTVSWIEARTNATQSFGKPIDIKIDTKPVLTGYVYVLRNAQHPKDVYKIGFTTVDPYDRASALYSTSGQPDMFNVVQSWHVNDPRAIEQQVHQRLQHVRVNNNREFFKERYEKIRTCIENVIGQLSA